MSDCATGSAWNPACSPQSAMVTGAATSESATTPVTNARTPARSMRGRRTTRGKCLLWSVLVGDPQHPRALDTSIDPMARLTRRQALQVAGTALGGGLAGCAFVGLTGSADTASTDDSTGSESTSSTPSLVRKLPGLVIRNETDQPRTSTLRIVPSEGPATTTTDSWAVSPNSDREVRSCPPLERQARITAIVEGYNPVSYDWTGGGGGALHVSIERHGLSVEPIVT